MLYSSSNPSEILLHSSSLSHDKIIKAPRKASECQTNISSSFSSSSSFLYSNTYDCIFDFTSHSFSEVALLQIFSNQSLLPVSYEKPKNSNKFNFYFISRIQILQWIEEVLNSTSLSIENRNSIYYRFSNAYMIITGKLKEKEILYTNLNFKILIVAIFLLCYKLEGFIVNKLIIQTIIKSFLSSVKIEEEILITKIKEMEVEICLLINYDIFLLENNIYQITQLLFQIISEKIFNNEEDLQEAISYTLELSNYEIENTKDCNILFDLYPIERSVISLISSIMIEAPDKKERCVEYLLSELNILHISKQQLNEYCDLYVQKINKYEDKVSTG